MFLTIQEEISRAIVCGSHHLLMEQKWSRKPIDAVALNSDLFLHTHGDCRILRDPGRIRTLRYTVELDLDGPGKANA
jgi:hypothetical protein